jgi:hypothetical protein
MPWYTLSLRILSFAGLLCGFFLLASGCKTKYICPAYQSAFQLDMAAYKIPKGLDSMAIAADTSLDVDVIAMLAERIRKQPANVYAFNQDSQPQFPANLVIKNEYLIIKRISRKKKSKIIASVPMITVFPESADSTKGKEATEGTEDGLQPGSQDGQKVPEGGDPANERPTNGRFPTSEEPPEEDTPAEAGDTPPAEGDTPTEPPADTPPKSDTDNAEPNPETPPEPIEEEKKSQPDPFK